MSLDRQNITICLLKALATMPARRAAEKRFCHDDDDEFRARLRFTALPRKTRSADTPHQYRVFGRRHAIFIVLMQVRMTILLEKAQPLLI